MRGRKPPEKVFGPDEGFYPATDFFLDLVDAETGTSIWKRSFRDLTNDTPFLATDDAILITKERELVALDYRDGSPRRIAEFRFEDGVGPAKVQMAGTGFLLSSSQDLLSLDAHGTLQYYRHYPRPAGLSLLESLVMGTAFVAFDALTAGLDRICAADPDCTSTGWTTESGAPLAPGGPVATSLAAVSFGPCFAGFFPACYVLFPVVEVVGTAEVVAAHVEETLRARMALVRGAFLHEYVYTDQPLGGRKGFSLVKLDIRDGEEVGRVWIDKRRPDYVLDPITGVVFVKENNKEIFALRFPS